MLFVILFVPAQILNLPVCGAESVFPSESAENIEKKIEAQLEKLKQLKAQKQAIDAREKTKQKEQERKDDTRRKILLGSYLIKKMQSNEANKEKILAELNEYLTENRDRQLFDLPDIEA